MEHQCFPEKSQNMDEFPHITVEHEVLKRHVRFRFNPQRCREAGLEEIPNANDYELVKLRRVYHFNKNTPDHVVLTIPQPVLLLVDNGTNFAQNNNFEINCGGEFTKVDENTKTVEESARQYLNVKNKSPRIEKYSGDSSEDEVIIEKCVPEVIPKNLDTTETETINNLAENFTDQSQVKSRNICNKAKLNISDSVEFIFNSQGDHINILITTNDVAKECIHDETEPSKPEDFYILGVSEKQTNHTELITDDIQEKSNNQETLLTEEPKNNLTNNSQAPPSSNEVTEDKSDNLIIFEEFSINEETVDGKIEENSNIQEIIFGLLSESPELISPEENPTAAEILWDEIPHIYQKSSSVLDPVELEMRKIHGEYVVQEHSYVQPLISEEDFVNSRNFNIAELLKIREPTIVEKELDRNFHFHSSSEESQEERFDMQRLVIDDSIAETTRESEIQRFITQEHSYGTLQVLPEIQEPITVAQENSFIEEKEISKKANSIIVEKLSDIQNEMSKIHEPTVDKNSLIPDIFKGREVFKETIVEKNSENQNINNLVKLAQNCFIKGTKIQEPIERKSKFNLGNTEKEFVVLEKSQDLVQKGPEILGKPLQDFIPKEPIVEEKTKQQHLVIIEKSFQSTIEKVSQVLENSLQNSIEKEIKILKKITQDGRTETEPQILQISTKKNPESVENLLEGTIEKERNILENFPEGAIEIVSKIWNNSTRGDPIAENLQPIIFQNSIDKGHTTLKKFPQNVEKTHQDLIEKATNYLETPPGESKMLENSFENTVKEDLLRFHSSIDEVPKIWEKPIQIPIANEPIILENPLKSATEKEHKILKRTVSQSTLDKTHQDLIEKIPKNLKIAPKEPEIVENFFESTTEKDLLKLDGTIDKVSDLEKLNQIPVENESTILENLIRDLGKKEPKTLQKLSNKPIGKKLKVSDNKFKIPKNIKNPFENHIACSIEKKSKILQELPKEPPEKKLKVVHNEHKIPENPIKNPNILEKLIPNPAEMEPQSIPILSPKSCNDQNIFEEVIDAIYDPPVLTTVIADVQDPLEEQMRQIHEGFVSIPQNEIQEHSPAQLLNDEPISKKPRTDYQEEEAELDFRGFTREEQNVTLRNRNTHDSPVSAIESVHDKSICNTPVSFIESVQDKSLCNTPVSIAQLKDSICEIDSSKLSGFNKRIKNTYPCNECDFKTHKRSHLKVHVRAHVHPFWCNLCLEMFPKIEDLHRHVKGYHDINRKTSRSNKIANVVVTEGKSLCNSATDEKLFKTPDDQAYKCGFCDYSSSYQKRLQHHVKVHAREKLYSCDKCDYATLTKWMFKRHMDDHASETQQFECEECGYMTMYRDQLDEHMQLHSRQKVYKCDQCSFTTAHLGYFNAHVGFHQPKIECSSEYGDADEEEIRKKPQVYKCQPCGFCSKQRAAVFKHGNKKHGNVTSVKILAMQRNKEMHMCTKCGFWAESEGAFKIHLMMHTDIKPNKCDFCDFITNKEFDLKVHEANHLNEKLKCTKCNRSCSTFQKLKDHIVKVHRSYKGELCHMENKI